MQSEVRHSDRYNTGLEIYKVAPYSTGWMRFLHICKFNNAAKLHVAILGPFDCNS